MSSLPTFMANGRLVGDVHSLKLQMGPNSWTKHNSIFFIHNSIFVMFCFRTRQVREDSKDGKSSYRIYSSKTHAFDIPFCCVTDNITFMSILPTQSSYTVYPL